MITIRDIEQGSPEWFALRVGVLSASRFKDMLMKPTTAGYRDLIAELATERLVGQPARDGFTSHHMQRGIELEAEARSLYEFDQNVDVDQITFVYRDDSKLVGCSPDGMVGDDGLLEIKCPKLATHVGYLLRGKLPTEYAPQVYGQMLVTGRSWCDFVSYHPASNVPMFRLRVEADQGEFDKLETAIDATQEAIEAMMMDLEAAA